MLVLKNILEPEKLFELAAKMHAVASMKMEGDDPSIYEERANEVCAWMATSGKALADAKYWKDKAIKNNVLNALKDVKKCGLPASTLNELIKADGHDLNYLANWIEQIDKEFKYQSDMLRSLISLRKQEMAASLYQR